MEAFTTHKGIGVPLRRSNVDTDQIIPAVYLKRVTRSGFEDGLFAAWRTDPEFILNVAPYDIDNGDPTVIPGFSTHVSEPERAAFHALEAIGLTDVVRPLVPEGLFTYWDYKQLRFPRNEGMRIDFILGTPGFADRVVDARIEREQRKGDAPSDHVPVLVELAGDDDDDDRPMIF